MELSLKHISAARHRFNIEKDHVLLTAFDRKREVTVVRYHAMYSGRVQGVGFRLTCRSIATRHRLNGWVANTPDGRVELTIQGDPQAMEAFLTELRRRMSGFIDQEDGQFESTGETMRDFEIRRQ